MTSLPFLARVVFTANVKLLTLESAVLLSKAMLYCAPPIRLTALEITKLVAGAVLVRKPPEALVPWSANHFQALPPSTVDKSQLLALEAKLSCSTG